MVPTLDHVALAVTDPDRSLAFYRDVVGVDGDVVATEYGYVIRTPNNVSFTLFRGAPATAAGESHFGFSRATPDDVRDFRAGLPSYDVTEVEWNDEPDHVSVKVAD